MVFGSGNKFRIRRSQSKASYLAARRERENGLPSPDIGSYKRTISPSGGALHESSKDLDTPHWTRQPSAKDSLLRNNNTNAATNNNLLRRTSLVESKCAKKELVLKPCDEDPPPLPDILPVTATRSQYLNRSLSEDARPLDRFSRTSPPRSPKTQICSAQIANSHEISNSPQRSPKILSSAQICSSQISSSPQRSPKILSSSQIPRSPQTSPQNVSPISERDPSRESPPRSSPNSTPQLSLTVSPRNSIQLSPPAFQSPPKVVPRNLSLQTSPVLETASSPTVPEAKCSLVSSASTLSISKSPIVSPPSTPTKSVSPVMIFEATSPSELAEKSVKLEQPKVIEGLQLIQRTEVTLRVNTCTIDAASQTEKEELPCTPLPTRRKLQEEIDCERLSQDLASHLSPSDRLKGILVPGPEHKKPTDYVSGLFKVEVTSRPRPLNSPFRSRTTTPNCSPTPSLTSGHVEGSTMKSTTTELSLPILEPVSPLSATSTYFTTSESKAKFLTRFSRDMSQYNIVKDTKDLNQKKEELVNRLDKKLEVLRSEQHVVNDECRMNDDLGEHVERHVARVARPHEAAKFRLHVAEVGKITSLLLGLSGRLARAENALMGLASEHTEKKILESKRDKLQEQLAEAKKLKESIDKRSVCVSNILYQYLSSEEYADYDHFINMKAKLIMDGREIADKIKLGEEQLVALKETLTVND